MIRKLTSIYLRCIHTPEEVKIMEKKEDYKGSFAMEILHDLKQENKALKIIAISTSLVSILALIVAIIK